MAVSAAINFIGLYRWSIPGEESIFRGRYWTLSKPTNVEISVDAMSLLGPVWVHPTEGCRASYSDVPLSNHSSLKERSSVVQKIYQNSGAASRSSETYT